MIPTHVERYEGRPFHSEFRVGWASWDDGTFQNRSIKWAYRDTSGKISRGCPEIPFDILVDMVIHAHKQGELSAGEILQLQQTLIPQLSFSDAAVQQ